MATTYDELKTEIADFINRSDLTARVDTFIDQAEAEMQVRCKEIEFETRSTITVTAGIAALPTGWLSARSVVWNGDTSRPLTYVTPAKLEAHNASSPTFVNYYTIVGTDLRFADDGDGEVIATYNAKFTPLSESDTSNAILAEFPSAYLYGALKHAAIFCKDFESAKAYTMVFEEQMRLVTTNNAERKYAGASLQVRCA